MGHTQGVSLMYVVGRFRNHPRETRPVRAI